MHVLIVNDDGPPSSKSPYVQHLVNELRAAGHIVSVVLPDSQRSWIGKAHLINETIQCTRSQNIDQDGWMFVNSTPAACVHIGLYHHFKDNGPVDLVISGPNFGLNASALFALSSGTIGAALEAALCRKRAVAFSFDQSGEQSLETVVETVRNCVKIAEALMRQWPIDDDSVFYSVNMIVSKDISQHKIVWAGTLQNFWAAESAFVEVTTTADSLKKPGPKRATSRFFQWAPKLELVDQGTGKAQLGQDVGVLAAGHVSITPLRANFAAAFPNLHGKQFYI